MKNTLLALSLLSITTLATRSEAQSYAAFGSAAETLAGGFVVSAGSLSLAVTSLVLDGILVTSLGSGEQVKRGVVITNLVFSLVAVAVNAGLIAGSVAVTRGEVTGLTAFPVGALAVNAASAIFSGVLLKTTKAPVTLSPTVLNGGAGASLTVRW